MRNNHLVMVILSVSIMVVVGCSSNKLGTKQLESIQHTDGTLDPLLGKNVFVFDASMDVKNIQMKLNEISRQQKHNEFGTERYAILFKPGEYKLRVNVDYYMHVAGLGRYPGDVTITGAVQSKSHTGKAGGGNNITLMFWRAVENIAVKTRGTNYWAVSQAAPFRRMHIHGDLKVDLNGWGSGGYIANSIIDGTANASSQQQWFTRNSEWQRWEGGNWNMVFVGVKGAPTERWGSRPYTVVEQTPRIREKPFLHINEVGEYKLFVPEITTHVSGVSWKERNEKGRSIPLSEFHIAHEEKDDASTLNQALAEGRHLFFTPGMYRLDSPLIVTKPGTIIYGMGMPTLIPTEGMSAMEVADVEGVVIAGIVADAGPKHSPVLFKIGSEKSKNNSGEPITINDMFCRVGGMAPGKVNRCVEINSNNVIADHFWLWRADHGVGAKWDENTSDHGLVVNGDNVTVYGLFNEHFQKHQTVWNGEGGETYFYQSEIPYDPPNQDAWMSGPVKGYAAYKVADHVKKHTALGLGIYSFFYNDITLQNAIESSVETEATIQNIVNFTAREGGIQHFINGKGASTLGQPIGARFYVWDVK
ncbi:MAG: adenylyl cyclase [Reichenbachiella sp.]